MLRTWTFRVEDFFTDVILHRSWQDTHRMHGQTPAGNRSGSAREKAIPETRGWQGFARAEFLDDVLLLYNDDHGMAKK